MFKNILEICTIIVTQALVIWFYGWAFMDFWWFDFTEAVKWSVLLWGARMLIMPKVALRPDQVPLTWLEVIGVHAVVMVVGVFFFGVNWLIGGF